MDVKKAFDTIDHETLLEKLDDNFTGPIFSSVCSCSANTNPIRTNKVWKVLFERCRLWCTPKLLGLFFILYVNDLRTFVNSDVDVLLMITVFERLPGSNVHAITQSVALINTWMKSNRRKATSTSLINKSASNQLSTYYYRINVKKTTLWHFGLWLHCIFQSPRKFRVQKRIIRSISFRQKYLSVNDYMKEHEFPTFLEQRVYALHKFVLTCIHQGRSHNSLWC